MMRDLHRRHLLLVAFGVLVLLSGCQGSVWVEGEVTSVSETEDGYVVTVNVTEHSSDDYFSNITVYGYGPRGEVACTEGTEPIGSDEQTSVTMQCSPFPQVVLFTSDQLGQDHPEPGFTVHHEVIGYEGFENGSHRWQDVADVEETGNPPTKDRYSGPPVLEERRCRQRLSQANVSVYDAADWVDQPPRYPRVTDEYRVAIRNVSNWDGDFEEPSGALVDAPAGVDDTVRVAARNETHPTMTLNRSEFFAVMTWAEGAVRSNWSELPDDVGYVSESDNRRENCHEGAGNYTGTFDRTYRYGTSVDGEEIGIAVGYERWWNTPNGSVSSNPPSEFFRVGNVAPAYIGPNRTAG